MMDISGIQSKEQSQSHTFVLFPYGTPYAHLGWKKYRDFNRILQEFLNKLSKDFGVKFYTHEHEVITIDRCFVWVVSFFEEDIKKQIGISSYIINFLNGLVKMFFHEHTNDIIIANGKSSNANEIFQYRDQLDLLNYYNTLIDLGEGEIKLKDTKKPKEKSFEMPLLDLNSFEGELNVSDFVKKIDDYLYETDTLKRHQMYFAHDGFWSTKYPELKLLREEFIPLKHLIKKLNIPDDDTIHLGFERLPYDACFTSFDKNIKTIVEITGAIPKDDHLLLSLFDHSPFLRFSVKNEHKLKLCKDSVPRIIIDAIEKKHRKNYPPGRILIVTLPVEYVYQCEEYIIDEIINEVSCNCTKGMGDFSKVLLLCNGKFKDIFSHDV